MEILVCIKQVPDTTEIRIDPETNTLIRTGVPSIMNPFDAYAVEQALQLKEMTDGRVTVVTMGPPQAKSILGDALAMGVDDAYLVTDRKFGGSDTLATSYILASVARKLGPFKDLEELCIAHHFRCDPVRQAGNRRRYRPGRT